MDFSPVLQPLITAIWYLVPIALVAGLIRSPWFRGRFGEFLVNFATRYFLDSSRYHLIRNVTLPTEDGTTQIDHIIVSRYGVFVVETKNMKGWIFGNPRQKFWTQKIFRQSYKFQNPLHQNYKHVKALQELTGLSDQQIHSVVVFVGDSTFKTPMPENVTHGGGYIRFIRSRTEERLTEEEVQKAIRTIESRRLAVTFGSHRKHVAHVRGTVSRKKTHQNVRSVRPKGPAGR